MITTRDGLMRRLEAARHRWTAKTVLCISPCHAPPHFQDHRYRCTTCGGLRDEPGLVLAPMAAAIETAITVPCDARCQPTRHGYTSNQPEDYETPCLTCGGTGRVVRDWSKLPPGALVGAVEWALKPMGILVNVWLDYGEGLGRERYGVVIRRWIPPLDDMTPALRWYDDPDEAIVAGLEALGRGVSQ